MPAERKGVPYPAVAMVIIAILSVQLGSALATDLFDELGVGGVVFMRALVSAIVLMIIWRPNLRLRREDIPVTLMFGVALAGMNLAFYESIDRIPLGTAVTIEFIGPLSVALITSHRRKDLIWVAMAATGILLLTGGIGGDDLDVAGILLALLAGILWGSYIVLGKRMGEQYVGGQGLAIAMVVSTILTLPFAFGGGMSELAQPEVLGLIVFVGILSSAFPFSLEMEAMRRLPSNVFGVFMSLEPAIAAMIGFLVLDQGVAPRELVAIALVVTASAGALRSAGVPEPIDH